MKNIIETFYVPTSTYVRMISKLRSHWPNKNSSDLSTTQICHHSSFLLKSNLILDFCGLFMDHHDTSPRLVQDRKRFPVLGVWRPKTAGLAQDGNFEKYWHQDQHELDGYVIVSLA